ncbi:MAG: pseudouridine synthase [Eubacteriales bacterium]|nr:rRNA pseudouridine synthase [Clostridiales bacterium]MDD7688283.1 pseudouridine synthase [Clostridiales bacterium]MDY2598259.1 pseudouridine synthase [Eubacteriales bacterium]MDY4622113.1 pseudouridine synthase [Eubacteriales bacterium]
MRLQKYLADAGIASRRKCEQLIEEGRVKLNGAVAEIGMNVNDGDVVTLDGKRVRANNERVMIAFYKPKNVICSNAEDEDRKKVTDFFKELPYRLYTVGRLDYDSEGLILVTNDGDAANRLMHPRYGLSKTYNVLCSGRFTDAEIHALASGVMLEDGMTAPARVKLLRETDNGNTELSITIHEGRNRQVRRMVAAVGHDTLRLVRVSIGKLTISGLKSGQWRFLSREETELLLK